MIHSVEAHRLTAVEVDDEAELRSRLLEGSLENGWITITVPAPAVPPERLLAGSQDEPALVWDPPGNTAWAGLGAASLIDLDGARPLEHLRERAESEVVFARSLGEAEASPTLRWFGGMAFAPSAEEPREGRPWSELGNGFFILPRLLYVLEGGSGRLTFTARGDELADPEVREHWVRRVFETVAGLERPPGTPSVASTRVVETLALDDWSARIEDIREAIRSGAFEKIVAARCSRVERARSIDPVAVLGRLSDGLRWSTRFLFRRGREVFLGATPERLVLRSGASIETEALAGSIGLGDQHARQLMASDKDRREHELVVEEIVRRLRALDIEPEVGAEPSVRELREVLHLHTPIRGRSLRPPHVLDLVEALHPTPAVGGVPTRESIDWIVEREEADRGWYSGPVGWFEASGDGEFAVSLRSCLVRDRSAWLFAGAGIVEDSDPVREYEETALKQCSLLRALDA